MSLLVEEACNIFSLRKMKGILDAKKKGQLNIGDAPGVVLIVLFLFMLIGTAGFILDKYKDSFGADETGHRINETLASVDEVGEYVAAHGACNFENFAVTAAINNSGVVINSANYSTNADTGFINISEAGSADYHNGTIWNVTYTYDYSGIGCNITLDLNEEVEDNVSIAGMVLTISLIGIVLSILIGLFYVFTGKKGM